MAVIGDSGPQTQRDLVVTTRMDKVAVNRACKELEDRGLAARTANERDGRSHHLELTAAGKAMHGEIMPIAPSSSVKPISASPWKKALPEAPIFAITSPCRTR